MYVITNRAVSDDVKTLEAFGKHPNSKGANELRLLEATKSNGDWQVKAMDDKLKPDVVEDLKARFNLGIDVNLNWYGSLEVACKLFAQASENKQSILFFVHGFNNDVRDVLEAALEIQELYNVIVVPVTWPANGGGAISGTLSYKSDKSDARISAGALNRVIGKIQEFHSLFTEARKKELQKRTDKDHPDNPQAAYTQFVKTMADECKVTLNLLCHSMGNYVLKHTLSTSENASSKLVFDNINLVAADANNANHASWVGKLDVRKRINIVINENDSALRVSRIKPGKEQRVRLGHFTRELNSPNAHYIDVTDAEHVGSEHTYFKGDAVRENKLLKDMFTNMFNGRRAEHKLTYHADNNSYKLKPLDEK